MIEKLNHLTDKELKRFYRRLTDHLLMIFGDFDFDKVEDLQEAFNEWKNDDLKDYRDCLDSILSEIAPDGIDLTWRDCKKLTKNRWKLCKVCNRPFLTFDKKNRMVYCYNSAYKRYRKGRKESKGNYLEGKFYKSAEQGTSFCFMIAEAVRKRVSHKDELEYIVGF
jgi:hypothetical protein